MNQGPLVFSPKKARHTCRIPQHHDGGNRGAPVVRDKPHRPATDAIEHRGQVIGHIAFEVSIRGR
jgi:hypothetical protein